MTRPATRVHVRPRMGTWLGLTLRAPAPVADGLAAHGFALVARVERMMTRLDAVSPLNAVNRSAGSAAAVPHELARALRMARRLAELTGGAFDPTIGALTEVWRAASTGSRLPTREALAAARALTGWNGLGVRGCRATLARPGMTLDLDGFGKGWAADRVAAALASVTGVSALVNFGESSLVAVGGGASGGWSVVLRHPFGGVAGRIRLRNRACSTSATFGHAWRIAGRRWGHVIDPRSGWPAEYAAQATALADSAAVAEAAATALLVLGPQSLAWVAERLECETCWIDRAGLLTTAGFPLEPAAEEVTA